MISIKKDSVSLINEALPSLIKKLSSLAGVQLPGGDLLVIGGYTGSTYNDEYLTLKKGSSTWTETGRMKIARSSHPSVFLDGAVFSCGGENESSVLSHHESFTLTGAIKKKKELPIALYRHSATKYTENEILVCGGWDSKV